DAYFDADADSRKEAFAIIVPLYTAISDDAGVIEFIEADVALLPIPPADNRKSSPVGFALYTRLTSGVDATLPLSAAVALQEKGSLIVEFSDSDGFLHSIFGDSEQRVDFGLGIAWSSVSGLTFMGQLALEATIPIDGASIGVARLNSLTIGVGAIEGGGQLSLGVSGTVQLGPVGIAIDRVGVSARLVPV